MPINSSNTAHLTLLRHIRTAIDVANNTSPVIGVQANVSSAQTTEEADQPGTNNIDCRYMKSVTAFGESSVASTITLMQSMDNDNFYETGYTQVLADAGEFSIMLPNANARYYGLSYSAAGNYTATIAGK